MTTQKEAVLENGARHTFRDLSPDALVLGISWSTQALALWVMHAAKGVVFSIDVEFAEFSTAYGMKTGWAADGTGTVYTTPKLFLAALDRALTALKESSVDVAQIAYLTGNVQQHGTIGLTGGFASICRRLDPALPIEHQLDAAFASAFCSIWKTSNTAEQCALLSQAFGGDEAVARATGAPPQRRFSGPLWAWFAHEMPAAYARAAHMTQLSGFAAGVFAGTLAPIELGNGLGSNLLQHDGTWSQTALTALEPHAPGLAKKLPTVTHSLSVVGPICDYFVKRFGFSPECEVIVFTGDNPESALGCGLYSAAQRRRIASFGTSKTQFALVGTDVTHDPNLAGVIFGGVAGGHLALECHSNGMQAIEMIRDRFHLDWPAFGKLLASTSPGNGGKRMIYLPYPEITPITSQPIDHYYGALWSGTAGLEAAPTIRGVVESHAVALMAYSQWLGEPQEFLATGGASGDEAFLQVFADVTGARFLPVLGKDSTTQGSCLRAMRLLNADVGFDELIGRHCKFGKPITPKVERGFYAEHIASYPAAVEAASAA